MSTPNAHQLRREELRGLVLGYLAERQALAFRVEAITRSINREEAGDFTTDEVEEALAFLAGHDPKLAESAPSALGATRSWQATSAGVLQHERS